MLISPIFSMHKMAAQAPPDTTSLYSTSNLACVQVDYCAHLTLTDTVTTTTELKVSSLYLG